MLIRTIKFKRICITPRAYALWDLVTICRWSEEVRALIEKSNVLFALTSVNRVKTSTERFTLEQKKYQQRATSRT